MPAPNPEWWSPWAWSMLGVGEGGSRDKGQGLRRQLHLATWKRIIQPAWLSASRRGSSLPPSLPRSLQNLTTSPQGWKPGWAASPTAQR